MITIDTRTMSGGREITEIFQDGQKIGFVSYEDWSNLFRAGLTMVLPDPVSTSVEYDGHGATPKEAVERAIKNLGYALGYAEDLQEILKKEKIFD